MPDRQADEFSPRAASGKDGPRVTPSGMLRLMEGGACRRASFTPGLLTSGSPCGTTRASARLDSAVRGHEREWLAWHGSPDP